jgi:predicted N-acetyltransferase YhbS
MSTMSEVSIRPARQADLEVINRIIDAAVMTWNLPARVKRLSLPSYHYNAFDLEHFAIYVAEQDGQIVGVVAWDKHALVIEGEQQGLLLHGIYVHPDKQHRGIGSRLFRVAENAVQESHLAGLLVKAQKDAEAFYVSRGMHKLAIADSARDFASRYWKPLGQK